MIKISQKFACAALTVLTVLTALPGCDADDGVPLEPTPRASPSPAVVAMAADPVYLAYLNASTQRAGTMLKKMIVPAVKQYGDTGPARVFHRWADYRGALTSVGIDPDDVTNADAPLLTQVTGVSLTQIATSIERMHALDAHHGFLSMTPIQHATAVNLALANPTLANTIDAAWGDPSVLVELGAESIDACVLECVESSAESFLIASSLIYVIAEALAETDLDLIYIAMEGAVLAVGAAVYQQCIDECGAEIEEECDADSDCDNKEYCDRGWLTIGKNQCVFSRDDGDICTRDEQCETGCCKYHAFSNLVHPVCRPSDKCD
jgi:hypothetical protein